jgi:hypothetical protein
VADKPMPRAFFASAVPLLGFCDVVFEGFSETRKLRRVFQSVKFPRLSSFDH